MADTFFFLADGTTVPLHWLLDEMVIEPTPGASAAVLQDAVRRRLAIKAISARSIGQERNLFVADLAGALPAALWLERAAQLADGRTVRGVYPVFAHPPLGHRVIVTDEILVCLKDGVAVEAVAASAAPTRLRVVERERYDNRIVRLRIENPTPLAALEVSNALFRKGVVRWAEPNSLIELRRAYLPNDPDFVSEWHLDNTRQFGGALDADIDAPEAWDLTRGNPTVTVAIVDDGLDIDHADLRANIFTNVGEIAGNGVDDDANGYIDDVNGYDFYNSDANPRPDGAEDFHATPCAGMAAAVGDNAVGVSGVAPRCTILPVRIIGPNPVTVLQVTRAIQYAGSLAEVVSMSWSSTPHSSIQAAVEQAATQGRAGRGCVLCAATGNESRTDFVAFPASLGVVMAVGASNVNDVRSAYSNYTTGFGVFLLAPSSDSSLVGVYTTFKGDQYSWFSGTSAATPEAAGAAALILSAAPTLTRGDVENALRVSADKISPSLALYDANGYSNAYGYGRLNARRAIERVVPDLSVTSFDFQPEVVVPGQFFAFAGRVRNVGLGPSGDFWLEFWLSNNPSFATLDLMACSSRRIPALPPGAEVRLEEIRLPLLVGVPDGFYRFGIVVDRLDEQIDLSRYNNTKSPQDRILQVGTGSTDVDLAIESLDFWPDAVTSGSEIVVQAQMVNQGRQMSRPVWIEFWVTDDPIDNSFDHLLSQSVVLKALGPGERYTVPLGPRTVYGPPLGPPDGLYRVGIAVDRLRMQRDTNARNNTVFRYSKWLTVGQASRTRSWQLYR